MSEPTKVEQYMINIQASYILETDKLVRRAYAHEKHYYFQQPNVKAAQVFLIR